MTNPYGHSGYTDSEEVAREKTLGAISWQREQMRNEQRELLREQQVIQSIRKRAIWRACLWSLAIGVFLGAMRLMYLYFLWF